MNRVLYENNLLEDVSGDVLSAHRVLGDTFLVYAHEVKNLKSALVNFATAIADNAYDDLFPPF